MNRDFDLIRKLLIFFEEKPGPELVEIPAIEGYEDIAIKYQLVLLYDAGFLRCEPIRSSSSDRVIYVLPFELTWQGHEFLQKIRNETTWNKIKDMVLSRGSMLAFGIISELGTKLAMDTVTGTKS